MGPAKKMRKTRIAACCGWIALDMSTYFSRCHGSCRTLSVLYLALAMLSHPRWRHTAHARLRQLISWVAAGRSLLRRAPPLLAAAWCLACQRRCKHSGGKFLIPDLAVK